MPCGKAWFISSNDKLQSFDFEHASSGDDFGAGVDDDARSSKRKPAAEAPPAAEEGRGRRRTIVGKPRVVVPVPERVEPAPEAEAPRSTRSSRAHDDEDRRDVLC